MDLSPLCVESGVEALGRGPLAAVLAGAPQRLGDSLALGRQDDHRMPDASDPTNEPSPSESGEAPAREGVSEASDRVLLSEPREDLLLRSREGSGDLLLGVHESARRSRSSSAKPSSA